jgi:hypothetical protein
VGEHARTRVSRCHCRRIPWRMAKNSTHHKRCCRRITWSARTYKHRAAATSRRISRHAVSERALLPTRRTRTPNGVREHASRVVTATSQDQCGYSIIRSPHTRPRCELLLRGAHRTSPRAPQPQPKPAQHITQGHSCTILLRVVTCCCWLLQVPVPCDR